MGKESNYLLPFLRTSIQEEQLECQTEVNFLNITLGRPLKFPCSSDVLVCSWEYVWETRRGRTGWKRENSTPCRLQLQAYKAVNTLHLAALNGWDIHSITRHFTVAYDMMHCHKSPKLGCNWIYSRCRLRYEQHYRGFKLLFFNRQNKQKNILKVIKLQWFKTILLYKHSLTPFNYIWIWEE